MLPSFINIDDIFDRFRDKIAFYKRNKISLGIIRKNAKWCSFVSFHRGLYGKIFDIRLTTDAQLASVCELLKEFCDRWGIIYRE